MVINILSNRSEWTFYFLSSVQFNFTIGGINLIDNGEAHLKVLIPAEVTLDRLDVQTNSGDIEIVDTKVEKAYLKSTEGRVRVRRVAIAESLVVIFQSS